jgi:hypothetical protein
MVWKAPYPELTLSGGLAGNISGKTSLHAAKDFSMASRERVATPFIGPY